MRIISGEYKRRRFEVPRSFKARPTTDFAKEGLFNMVDNLIDLEGKTALDLFAGTGSITAELLSRGCQPVISVELDAAHHSFISKVVKELGTKNAILMKADVFRYLEKCKGMFDFIFADPPYQLPNIPRIVNTIFQRELLLPGGIFVLEHGKNLSFTKHPCFISHRHYGSVNFSFFAQQPQEATLENGRKESHY